MDIKQLAPDFFVSPQLRPEEVAAVAAQGIRAIVCNRPDGEDPGQPSAAEIRAAAEKAGLHFVHIPVTSRQVSEADARRMAEALASLPKPILAYCRSGARSEALWQAAHELPPASPGAAGGNPRR
jgi:sulfide:quinone oxidoreductase